MKIQQYNLYKDYPGKRALILSTKQNFSNEINSFKALERFILSRDLAFMKNKPVDIVNYRFLNSYKDYDEIILAEEAYRDTNKKSIYFSTLEKFLDRWSGKVSYLNLSDVEDKVLTFRYLRDNEITSEYKEYNKSKDNIVFGDRYSLLLWDKDTYVRNINSFNFPYEKVYDKSIVFFGELFPPDEKCTYQLADNLFRKLVKINSKERVLILPLKCNRFLDIIESEIIRKLGGTGYKILKLKNFNKKSPYKNTVWDFKNNIIKEIEYETV